MKTLLDALASELNSRGWRLTLIDKVYKVYEYHTYQLMDMCFRRVWVYVRSDQVIVQHESQHERSSAVSVYDPDLLEKVESALFDQLDADPAAWEGRYNGSHPRGVCNREKCEQLKADLRAWRAERSNYAAVKWKKT